MLTTVNSNDVIAIVNSVHQSPHQVLGMHVLQVPVKGKDRNVISARAFLPDAKQAFVFDPKDKSNQWEMQKIHPDGFFEGILWDRTKKFYY